MTNLHETDRTSTAIHRRLTECPQHPSTGLHAGTCAGQKRTRTSRAHGFAATQTLASASARPSISSTPPTQPPAEQLWPPQGMRPRPAAAGSRRGCHPPAFEDRAPHPWPAHAPPSLRVLTTPSHCPGVELEGRLVEGHQQHCTPLGFKLESDLQPPAPGCGGGCAAAGSASQQPSQSRDPSADGAARRLWRPP